jgi:hypothetical protein
LVPTNGFLPLFENTGFGPAAGIAAADDDDDDDDENDEDDAASSAAYFCSHSFSTTGSETSSGEYLFEVGA